MKDKLLDFFKTLSEKYKDDIIVLKQKSTLNALSVFCIENQITADNASALLKQLVNEGRLISNINNSGVFPFDAYFIASAEQEHDLFSEYFYASITGKRKKITLEKLKYRGYVDDRPVEKPNRRRGLDI